MMIIPAAAHFDREIDRASTGRALTFQNLARAARVQRRYGLGEDALCEIARRGKIAQLDAGFHAQHRDLELQLALWVLAFVTRQLVQGLAGVAPR
jgi:hypothetical protein